MQEFISQADLSKLLNRPLSTLRYWRATGEHGPRSFKLGGRVVYKREDVERWIQEQYDAENVPTPAA